MNISAMINNIILITLGIATFRDVLMKFGFKPRWKWIANLFEPNYEKELLKKAFGELGYSNSQLEEIKVENNRMSKKYKDKSLPEACKANLIALMANFTQKLPDECEYGNNTRQKSKYYINTMSMVHNTDNLRRLTSIMYNEIIEDKENKKSIDFIIVPKSGNPLLAKSIADRLKVNLLVLKGNQEESSLKISILDDPETYFKINFEGGNELLKIGKEDQKRKLNGIIIDCNTSGGAQLFNAIETFNQLVDLSVINAEKVKNAYVLFRVDDGENKFTDQTTNRNGYRLIRYFDLNEELKRQLFELTNGEKELDFSITDDKIAIDSFLEKVIKKSTERKRK